MKQNRRNIIFTISATLLLGILYIVSDSITGATFTSVASVTSVSAPHRPLRQAAADARPNPFTPSQPQGPIRVHNTSRVHLHNTATPPVITSYTPVTSQLRTAGNAPATTRMSASATPVTSYVSPSSTQLIAHNSIQPSLRISSATQTQPTSQTPFYNDTPRPGQRRASTSNQQGDYNTDDFAPDPHNPVPLGASLLPFLLSSLLYILIRRRR